ncbi:MAG: stage V sporulation protein AC [Oscillospiraceae bacterium]|nr:stage V sporulation protein AC [Oscillospiraceae bacterium]
MNMSKEEYAKYVKDHEPSSPHVKNFIKAYIIGGGICVLGQALINFYQFLNLSKDNAGAATSITLIFLSALFTGLGLYDKIAKHAGAGTLVPITGFANSIVSEAIEFKSEGFVLGMCSNLFKLAGPVLVYGTSASVIYGIILLIGGAMRG